MNTPRLRHELGSRAPWLHDGGIDALAFATDGSVLSAGRRDARTWVLATGEIARRTERGPRAGAILASDFRPHLRRWIALAGSEEGYAFRTWDLGSGALVDEVAIEEWKAGERDLVLLAFDAPGRRALVQDAAADPRTTHLVSVENGRLLATFDTAGFAGAFLSTGEILLATSAQEIEMRAADGSDPRVVVAQRTTTVWDEERVDEVNGIDACLSAPVFLVSSMSGIRKYRGEGVLECELKDHDSPMAITPHGERFATSAPGRIVIHDGSGREIRSVPTGSMAVSFVVLNEDARFAALASREGEIAVHTLSDEGRAANAARTAPGDGKFLLPGAVSSIAAAPEVPRIVLACAAGELFLWTVPESAPIPLAGFGSIGPTVEAFFLPDGSVVAIGAGRLRRMDASTGDLLLECTVPDLPPARNMDGTLVTFPLEGRIGWVDARSGTLVRDVRLEPMGELPEVERTATLSFARAALSPSGRFAVTTPEGVAIWNPDGTALLAVPAARLEPDAMHGMAEPCFLSDDRLVLGSVFSPAIGVDVATGAVTRFPADGPRLLQAFSADRTRCAFSRSPESVSVWDLSAGARIQEVTVRHAGAMAFLADGSLVAATDDRRILVWGKD